MWRNDMTNPLSILKRRSVKIALVLLAAGVVSYLLLGRGKPPAGASTFVARRGPLLINILEGGSLESRQALEVRSEIKGYQGTKILSIAEEGYFVTDEDVKKGKLLVELDSSDLKQRIIQQNIQYQSSLATYIDTQQSMAIQINQNKSDIKMAEQKAKFSLMDLEKYMGDVAIKDVLAKVGLPSELFTNETEMADQTLPEGVKGSELAANQVSNGGVSNKSTGAPSPSSAPLAGNATNSLSELPSSAGEPIVGTEAHGSKRTLNSLTFDFTEYVDEARLGDGAAKQNLRKLEDDVLVAMIDLNVSSNRLTGTLKLREREFVTKTDVETDQIKVKKDQLRLQTVQTALELFKKYEFVKEAERALSTYEEALNSLDRASKEAVARLAQSRARFRSAEGQFQIQDNQRIELIEQLAKCTIRAQKPGLVVYGGGGSQRFYNSEEQIREGATVRERQPIITIPDTTQMAVKVRIPEAHIKKVKKGMKARIQVDAFPDEELVGEVTKVGVLPDSQDRWMNPDLKVYLTTISIEGVRDWVKPGMSAKVEIHVKKLDDVVYVPVQAVVPIEGKHYCFLGRGLKPEKREVEIGDFNEEFIAIKKGIAEGEVVQLRSSEMPLDQGEEDHEEEGEHNAEKPSTPASPAESKPDVSKPKKVAAL